MIYFSLKFSSPCAGGSILIYNHKSSHLPACESGIGCTTGADFLEGSCASGCTRGYICHFRSLGEPGISLRCVCCNGGQKHAF